LATCGGQVAITSDEIRYCAGGFGIGVTLALVLVSWHRRSFAWAPLYVPLLLLHPAWIMSLRAGDCGMGMRFLSVSSSLILAAMLICQIFWPYLSRRRFIFSLCLISWATYFAGVVLHQFRMGDFYGGVAAQALTSFILGGMHLRSVALALTFVCFFQGLSDRMHHRRSHRSTLENAAADKDIRSSEDKLHPRSRLALRIFSSALSLLLITWVVLYLGGLVGDWWLPNTIAAVFALGWSVILIIAAVRGKFPGWESEREGKKERGKGV